MHDLMYVADPLEWQGEFLRYSEDVFHCNRCHRVVRTYDANNDAERLAMLGAHIDAFHVQPL